MKCSKFLKLKSCRIQINKTNRLAKNDHVLSAKHPERSEHSELSFYVFLVELNQTDEGCKHSFFK